MTTSVVEFKKTLGTMIERKEFALPSNVSPDAFRNAALVAVQDNPKILEADQASVFKAIRTLAAAGLVPDGREAALVPFKTKQGNNWVTLVQAMPMVFGLVKMARRSGDVKDIRAHIVYEAEVEAGKFEYVVGDQEELRHEPILFGDRGKPLAVYAIARLKDGSLVREFMNMDEVDAIRRTGASQKVRQGEKYVVSDEPVGIWKEHFGEMAKKTVIRRLCKRLDLSAEDMRRIVVDEDQPIKDVTPQETTEERLRRLAMERQSPKEETPPEAAPEPAETVEDAVVVDPFEEGKAAHAAGKQDTDCPYPHNSPDWSKWVDGWFSAEGA
jgi:recombination protein RecT